MPPLWDASSYEAIVEILARVQYLSAAAPAPPWDERRGVAADWVSWLATEAAAWMPIAYRDAYLDPLGRGAHEVSECLSRDAETLCAPVYQLGPRGAEVRGDLRALLGMCAAAWRPVNVALGGSAANAVPPLAAFKHWDGGGPFAVPPELYRDIVQGATPLVLFPSVYRMEPLLLGLCAHEAGGHASLHGVPGWTDELRALIARAVAVVRPGPDRVDDDQVRAGAWDAWAEELACDFVAIRLIGPTFAFLLAGWMAAMNRSSGWTTSFSGVANEDRDRKIDPHPAQSVRLHFAASTILGLGDLSASTRNAYANMLLAIVRAGARDVVAIAGEAVISGAVTRVSRDCLALAPFAAEAARIASALGAVKMESIAHRSLAELASWSDADEAAAQACAAGLLDGSPQAGDADSRHVMAAAIAAAARRPEKHEAIVSALQSHLRSELRGEPAWPSSFD